MTAFHKIIPFILFWEEGIPADVLGQPLERLYAIASAKGVHNVPGDGGGPTLCGVTLATYTEYRRKQGYQRTTVADLRQMPLADWLAILKRMFWDRCKADLINTEMVAIACVDWAWHAGTHGIKGFQKVVGVNPDGIVGPVTIDALNGYPDQRRLFDKIQQARNIYNYTVSRPGSKNHRFRNGWARRVASITWDGFNFDV